jgi:hypothetical protein
MAIARMQLNLSAGLQKIKYRGRFIEHTPSKGISFKYIPFKRIPFKRIQVLQKTMLELRAQSAP